MGVKEIKKGTYGGLNKGRKQEPQCSLLKRIIGIELGEKFGVSE